MANPYGIIHRCIIRRESLPVLPCDCEECEWFVNSKDFNNCFWVLAHILSETPGYTMSIADIAELEGLTEEQVQDVINTAQVKLLKATRNLEDLWEDL